jgi:hypothetical protein
MYMNLKVGLIIIIEFVTIQFVRMFELKKIPKQFF